MTTSASLRFTYEDYLLLPEDRREIVGQAPGTRMSFGRLLEQLQNVRAYMD